MVHDLEGKAFVDQVVTFRAYRRSFYLNPEQWAMSKVETDLEWQEVKFEDGNKDNIPDKRGIYAFIVKHENKHFPPHGYIMYVGITGEHSNKRTLKKRFRDYLYEQRRNKRPKIHMMLQQFRENLYFNFSPLDDEVDIDLGKLEIDLNDALVPPVGRKDFSGKIKALRDALE